MYRMRRQQASESTGSVENPRREDFENEYEPGVLPER